MKKLGFGVMRMPLLDPDDQASIDQEQVNAMADYFIENGFDYVDVAYMYHNYSAEYAVKHAFTERYPREAFRLADKLPVAHLETADEYEEVFADQLRKTGVEYFDNYLLHDVSRQCIKKVEENKGFEFMMRLKEDGKAKRIGFSYHDNAQLLDEILTNHPEMEFVQLQINYADWEDEIIQSRKCYEVCRKHNKPVFVMEPVRGGALVDLPEEAVKLMKDYNPDASLASWAMRFAASLENVEIVLGGMSAIEHMTDNVSYMKDFVPLNDEEMEIIRKVTEIYKSSVAIPCTACRYCVNHGDGCPMDIAIPEYFAVYNLVKKHGATWSTIQGYKTTAQQYGVPADCIECGQCEYMCPQHIRIIDKLKLVPALTDDDFMRTDFE